MTRTFRYLLASGALVWLMLSVAVSGHGGLDVLVTVTPSRPAVGEPCRVIVVPVDAPDILSAESGHRIHATAEMLGHVMSPVAAELELTERGYAGELVFTMSGPWRVTIRLTEPDGEQEGAFAMDVESETASLAESATYRLSMAGPPPPTLFRPGWVAAGSIALVLVAVLIALAFRMRQREVAAPRASAASDGRDP